MRTVLLSPELFLAEGGIARIMRLYLLALCGSAGPADEVVSLVLNDDRTDDPRLARYSTPALRQHRGFARGKARFVAAAVAAGRNADRMVCGHLHQLPAAWLAKRFNPRLRYFLVAHGIEVWRPYSAVERLALHGAAQILCVSDFTRRQLRRFDPALDPARLAVVPNTLDPSLHPSDPAADGPPRANLQGPRLLTVARLAANDPYKGVDTLIEALPQIRRELPLAHLRIVGGGDDLPRLHDLARRLGATADCTFTGVLDDAGLRREYATSDIFALPSRKEGFGLVFLEAMTHGKPCLGARAGGIPEVVDETVGALAGYGNIPEIAAAVLDLVRHPRDPAAIRRRAESFAFPAFQRRLDAALA